MNLPSGLYLLQGCWLVLSGIMIFIGAVFSLAAYRRSRNMWPHPRWTWSLFLTIYTSILLGPTITLLFILSGSSSLIGTTMRSIQVAYLWLVFLVMSIIALLLWFSKMYRVMCQQYGHLPEDGTDGS